MKKRIIALLLCIVMMVSMFGCAGQAVIPRNLTGTESETVAEVTATPSPEVSEEPAVTATAAPTPEATEEPVVTATPTPTPEATESPEVTPTPAPVTSVAEEAGDNCAYCEETTAEDGTVTHAEDCVTNICSYCVVSVGEDGTVTHKDDCIVVFDGSENVGKYAELNSEFSGFNVHDGSNNFSLDDALLFYYDEFSEDLIMEIEAWYWDPVTTAIWYQVDAYSGSFPESTEDYTWPATAWIMQDYTDPDYAAGDALVFVTIEETEDSCEICGEIGCTALHFYCEICEDYDCGKAHLYCPACGEVDCADTHMWCGTCGDYDCGIEHEDLYTPATAPVIPENPTLTDGAEVSIVDEYGDPVTEEGFVLFEGMKSDLSAWDDLDETDSVSYRWQVCYDSANDLWVDIQGQTGKGILLSPAMIQSVLNDQGSAAIRCILTSGEETLTSAAIPVTVSEQPSAASFALDSGVSDNVENNIATAANEDENKVNVIVNYRFTDGTIAANPWAATLPKGVAYSTTTPITIPTIQGYTPQIEETANWADATLNGTALTLSFTAEELASDCTVNIVYQPAPVKVLVEHYWQNVDNDNYTLHETEELSLVTESTVGNVHKTYEGFYSLLYEHPTVAADGSTVVQIYYDRYYYLMTFDLGGGYGVEPVYARFGAPIGDVGTPTRAGYTFQGWTLDGNAAEIADEMPARNCKYVAVWTPGDPVNYTVVYWRENADDSNYSYWTQVTLQETPGETVSGSDSVAPYVSDEQYFTYNDHLTDKDVEIEGDGSTIINVYYNRNYYTLVFYYDGECNIAEHTHGTNCTNELICGTNGHTHDATCQRTLICDVTEHVHTDACTLQCGLPIHTAHNDDCLQCGKEIHVAHTVDSGCYELNCSHNTHTLECYGNPRGINTPNENRMNAIENIGEPESGYLYVVRRGNNNSTYYFYYNNRWYDGEDMEISGNPLGTGTYRSENTTYTANKYAVECNHAHAIADGCYDLICTKPIHAEHTEADGCYKDVIHIQHTDACYDHTSHSHTEDCYEYQCGLEPHTHDSTCYRGCTKFEHTHGDDCKYSNNNDYEIYKVIVAKYDAYIGDQWPTADDIEGFAYWTGTGLSSGGQSSRVLNMTANICINGGNKLLAHYKSTKYILNYWFEHFDQTVTPDGTTYVEHDGKIYKWSEAYSQTAYYGSLSSWGYKTITGMITTANNAYSDNNTFNLYYDRNRWDLKFYNVSEVVKTEADIMYEQPLVNYEDEDGNLLSTFIPDYPSTLEPNAYEFEGWYTTPECFEGTEVDFSSLTMPNGDLTLYANWVPVTRTVRLFLDHSDMEEETIIPNKMAELWKAENGAAPTENPYETFDTRTDVPHGSYIDDLTAPGVAEGYENIHPYSGYTFVGWFYEDEDGTERAFDPVNMPVTQDLDLYAKWSSNVLCPYEIFFALDENGDDFADTDTSGNIIYVADSITGSTLAGNSRTFDAKGDTALYANYQSGYYPNVASHTIEFKAQDSDNDGERDLMTFTFLYTPGESVPYTVRYLDKATGERVVVNGVAVEDKTVSDNTKAVVTENFKVIAGYMPDAYQKTLVVVPGGENVIIFWYTKDEVHALYQVNHYVQNLSGTGWIEYRTAAFTSDIGKDYSADALTITGFTFSDSYTDLYNKEYTLEDTTYLNGFNAYTKTALPGDVSFDAEADAVSGTLTANGMELNLYYTRATYPYQIYFLEYGTDRELLDTVNETASFGTLISHTAQNVISKTDEGVEFELYDTEPVTKTMTIKVDELTEGTVAHNKIIFYYTRCTQNLTVTKTVVGEGADPNQIFNFTVTIDSKYSFHQDSYLVGGEYQVPKNGTLTFSLKAGESITLQDLPTAEYTVTEQSLPLGYYCAEPVHEVTLTKDAEVAVTVNNEYAPAALQISKIVSHVENVPDNVTDFEFYITVPNGVTGTYSYSVAETQKTATVADGKMTITLEDGETALFANLPLGEYTVVEKNYVHEGYSATYADTDGTTTDGKVTLVKGETDAVTCTNAYPVGSLTITKTVAKAYEKDEWREGTFSFTISRTDGILNSESYPVYSGTTKIKDASVENGVLVVDIKFTELGTKTIKIDNLPKGEYTVEEAVNSDYITEPTNRTITTAISPEDYAGSAAFTNTYKKHLGDLSITKTVDAISDATAPADAAFTFTVSGAALTKESYMVSVGGAEATAYAVTEGKLALTLKGGESAVIKDLNLADYTVTETAADGFVLTSSTGTTGTILADADNMAKAEFTNTYVPRGNLMVSKFVAKEFPEDPIAIDANTKFRFTVTLDQNLNENIRNGSFAYTIKKYAAGANPTDSDKAVVSGTFTSDVMTFELQDYQYIVIEGLPACGYTIVEEDYTNQGYIAPYYDGYDGDGTDVIPANKTANVKCYNTLTRSVGDLKIFKQVVNHGTVEVPVTDYEFTITLNAFPADQANQTYKLTYNDTNGIITTYEKDGKTVTLPEKAKLDDGDIIDDGSYELVDANGNKIMLRDGWTVTVTGLPACGCIVQETVYESFGITYSDSYVSEGSTAADGVVLIGGNKVDGSNPVAIVNCTNTYPVDAGELKILKTVDNPYSEDLSDFDFEVEVILIEEVDGDEVALSERYPYQRYNADGTMDSSSGTVTSGEKLTLKNGQYIVITNLPVDTKYTVTETVNDAYKATYVGNDGVISAGETKTVEIKNTYYGKLTITKNTTGGDGTFLFHVTGNGVDMEIPITTSNGNGSEIIKNLPVGDYKVTEDTEWSWRFDPKESTTTNQNAQIRITEETTVTFENVLTNDKWLNHVDTVDNRFTANSTSGNTGS